MKKIESMQTLVTFVGADGRPLQFAIKEADGTAFDLNGYTVTIRAKLGATVKIDAQTVTVTEAANGLCEYTPQASQIDKAGAYTAQIKLSDVPMVDYTEVFEIDVREAV